MEMPPGFSFSGQLSTMAKESLMPSEIGEMIRLVSENNAIPLTAGEPSVDLYPLEELKEAFSGVFDDPSLLSYYKDDFGYVELRDWIVERMKTDGIAPDWVGRENILLTNGGGEAIELVAETLIDPGSTVLVESPTFTESLLTFRKQGAECLGVPSDENGIIPEFLEKILEKRRVRFLYTIPNFQNPSGSTTTLERRLEIIDIVRRFDIPVFEDDPYHYLSYEELPPRSYLSLAGEDKRILHCSSFSKTLAPGLRIGWLVVPTSIKAELNAFRVSAGLGRPAIIQKGVYRLLKNFDFQARVEMLQKVYRERRDAMAEALRKNIKDLGIKTNSPKGGFFIWGHAGIVEDMVDFARYAVKEKKVGIIPGSAFYVPGEADLSTFRLSFAKTTPAMAVEGVELLASAFKEYPKIK